MFIGVDSKARKVKKVFTGVDGKARAVKKVYIGDESGKARLVWQDFALPIYTGTYVIYGDEKQGRIELLTSGTLTLSDGVYDVFCVGGGGGGSGAYASTACGGGGGGGGYTKYLLSQMLLGAFAVTVGAGGGISGKDGGMTLVGSSLSAGGGLGASAGVRHSGRGGAGGSGGGGYRMGNGGSDGANGKTGSGGNDNIVKTGGIGQGATTRAFGEISNALYAGGGGGAYNSVGGEGGGGENGAGGAVNTGGGGGGDYNPSEDNTGYGGFAGGSGIVIIRWGY